MNKYQKCLIWGNHNSTQDYLNPKLFRIKGIIGWLNVINVWPLIPFLQLSNQFKRKTWVLFWRKPKEKLEGATVVKFQNISFDISTSLAPMEAN